ncbi:MAG: magnesium transporter, partial [Candidatus Bathyarchaeia archaeon]
FLSAGLISTLAMCAVGAIVAYLTFKRGLNPDNFTAPLTTSLGDALGVFLLIILARALILA